MGLRRMVGSADDNGVVGGQITEYAREADRYDALGRPDAADRLRHRARILTAYVPPE